MITKADNINKVGRPFKYVVGYVLETKSYGKLKILDRNDAGNMHVQFLETGYETVVSLSCLRRKKVRDPLRPNVCGVGYAGVGDYPVSINTKAVPAYNVWKGILMRCYVEAVPAYEYYGAKGVTVHPDWHNYQNFAEFYECNHKEGQDLDKDILQQGIEKKVYGPTTCVFVSRQVNAAEMHSRKSA
jgi:hypothetical protein